MQVYRHRILRLITTLILLLIWSSASLYAQQSSQPMPIVQEKVEYDALTNRYIIRTYVGGQERSEENTTELQSHSELSYAVFCMKKKKNYTGPMTRPADHS